MTGAAYGAAVSGLRPVLEIMFGDFLPLSMDCLVNQAAKFRFLSASSARAARRPLSSGRAAASARSTRRCRSPGSTGVPGHQDRGAVDARPTRRRC